MGEVHHFKAPDLVLVRGWQGISTFPRDGSVFEVRDIEGNITTATWPDKSDVIIVSDGLTGNPIHWRNPE